jgi:hypothetical protein
MLLNKAHLHLYGFTERPLRTAGSGLQRKQQLCEGHLSQLQCCFFINDYWRISLCLLSGTAIIFIMQQSDPLIKNKWQGELHKCHEVQQCLMENDVLLCELKSPIITVK